MAVSRELTLESLWNCRKRDYIKNKQIYVFLPYSDIALFVVLIAYVSYLCRLCYTFSFCFKIILYVNLLFGRNGLFDEANNAELPFSDTHDKEIGSLDVKRNTNKTRIIQ